MKIREAFATKAFAAALAGLLFAGPAFCQTPQPQAAKADDKAARETELRGLQDTMRASEEQRRRIEADVETIRADRARLSAALIETTAKVQENERQTNAANQRLAD